MTKVGYFGERWCMKCGKKIPFNAVIYILETENLDSSPLYFELCKECFKIQ